MFNILICYANVDFSDEGSEEQTSHLKFLEEEFLGVREIFKPHKDNNLFKPDIEENFELGKNLEHHLSKKYKRDLVLFSYSGHSTGKQFMFEDKTVRSEGLARRIAVKHCPNIKIVFLNGCLTNRGVFYFEDAGIPIIITTGNKLGDEDGKNFAIAFYKALVNEKETAEAAYNIAHEVVFTTRQVKSRLRNYSKKPSKENGNKAPSWEFAYKEEVYRYWKLEMGKTKPSSPSSNLEEKIKNSRTLANLFRGGYANFEHYQEANKILNDFKLLMGNSNNRTINQYEISSLIDKLDNNIAEYMKVQSQKKLKRRNIIGARIGDDFTTICTYLEKDGY